MSTRALAVLVVDEYPDTTTSYRDLFGLHGYDVRSATNAEEAMAHLDGWEPDVAILDLCLPCVDGFDLARDLRAPGSRRPVLVAVTGLPCEAERARAAGFDHFFVKPADPEELLRVLRACADRLESGG